MITLQKAINYINTARGYRDDKRIEQGKFTEARIWAIYHEIKRDELKKERDLIRECAILEIFKLDKAYTDSMLKKSENEFLDQLVESPLGLVDKIKLVEKLTGKSIFATIEPQSEDQIDLSKEELALANPPIFKDILDEYYKEQGLAVTSKVGCEEDYFRNAGKKY